MSKIHDYEYSRKTKYFFSIKNTDATGSTNAGSFSVLCNNSLLTSQSSTGTKPSKLEFNPIFCLLDLKYHNVSNILNNNKIRVSSTMFANSPIIVTIPNGYYSAITLAAALQAALISSVVFVGGALPGWLVDINNGLLRIRFTGTFATPANTTFEFSDFNGIDSRSLLGFSAKTATLAYADRATGVSGTLSPDMLPYDVLRVCSKNLAKRSFAMNNGYLSQVDTLFEIPVFNYNNLGETVLFETTDDLLSQEINPDFNTIDIIIKDVNGNVIQFDDTAKFSINFSITREIFNQTPEEKLKQIANYATYIS